LTAEASIDALISLMHVYAAPLGVVVMGDLFNPEWGQRLREKSPPHYLQLTQNPYSEGAVALVLSSETTLSEKDWLLSGGVRRLSTTPEDLPDLLARLFHEVPTDTTFYGRTMTFLADHDSSAATRMNDHGPRFVSVGPGYGTSMTGPLDHLVALLEQPATHSMAFLGRDENEIGYLHCERR